jgi:hypothetical protein
MIFDVLVHNTNAITKKACLDLCGDESTWAHQGYADSISDMLSIVIGKPNVTKGGQVVLVMDVDRVRPRAYLHRHKLHPKHFSCEGPNEVKLILDKLESMLISDTEDAENADPDGIIKTTRGIFSEKPHLTWDNYFSGLPIMKYAGENGYALTMTCRRDRLPDVPEHYLHKHSAGVNARSRSQRFEEPIFLTKPIPDTDSIMQCCSLQSTGPTNFLSVNAVNQCGLFGRTKERGRGNNKRKWAIEMNESRQLYLATYGKVDTMDHLIKNCCIGYR